MQDPVKIIHKEHDAVTAFCINKVREGKGRGGREGGRFFFFVEEEGGGET